MTHTNLRPCLSCKQEKLVAEFRDRWGTVRTKCNACRARIHSRGTDTRTCLFCGETKPMAEFNQAGRVRQRCSDCRASKRMHSSADTWPDQIGQVLRGGGDERSSSGGVMKVDKFLGRKLCFSNGLNVGFTWVHCNGETSKSSAVLAAYHPPRSITWLWAVYWNKPGVWFCLPRITGWGSPDKTIGSKTVVLPIVGSLSLCWQQAMWRDRPEGECG